MVLVPLAPTGSALTYLLYLFTVGPVFVVVLDRAVDLFRLADKIIIIII